MAVLACLISRAVFQSAGLLEGHSFQDWVIEAAILALTACVLDLTFGLHRIKLNAYAMEGLVPSALVAISLIVVGTFIAMLEPGNQGAYPVFLFTGMLFLILTVLARAAMRKILLEIYRRGNPRMPILIYGAGQTGQQLATALATDDAVVPVAFIDDDPRLQNGLIAGLKVHPRKQINRLISRHKVQRIVLAMPSAPVAVRARLTRQLAETGCEVHALPSFAELVENRARTLTDTRPVDLGSLLGREGFHANIPEISRTYRGKRILVTGAGGSIGAELCRQIIGDAPASLVMLDHSEHALFQIDHELRTLHDKPNLHPVLGSVCDRNLMDEVIRTHKVDIILHAAAYKHVPMVEMNAIEGMRNNVAGTRAAALAARDAGVERFILVSTDKAVRPTSVMGASKRMAELIVQDLATRSKTTRFAMVRFGNVLGSSGSVIPLFADQIAKGGPVTLTHNDITRYFMTIPEAARLVLLAGSFARGGDVFVLDMGKPIPVRNIARRMIHAAGLSVRDRTNPDGDIEIRVTGLRPGEKLHEELLIGADMLTTPHPKILRAQEIHLSELEIAKALQQLERAVAARDPALLQSTVETWIERARPAAASAMV